MLNFNELIERVYKDIAIAYHITNSKENVINIIKNNFKEPKKDNPLDVLGKGIYFLFEPGEVNSWKTGRYGEYVIKNVIKLDKMLITDPDIKFNKKTFEEQLKTLLGKDVYQKEIVDKKIMNMSIEEMIRKQTNTEFILKELFKSKNIKEKINGVIYSGVDGKTIFLHTNKSITPLGMKKKQEDKWKYVKTQKNNRYLKMD